MHLVTDISENRTLKTVVITTDLCVIGGGLAGVCTAIAAARAGLQVVLMQDRPVLGGNASSEVRLWTLGATSHMGNNNRWAREGGIVDELMVENTFRNPEGNPILFDALLLEKMLEEPSIRLLLDTAAFEVRKSDADTIASVRGFCPQDSTLYEITAPLFSDCSGDGIVGFLAGAAFRIGQEASSEFGEKAAPAEATSDLLGHSMYFMSKDLGRPVSFVPPSFALPIETVRRIHRYRGFDAKSQACNFWWVEFGGHLDTIHETQAIKRELSRVAYGIWNYIKNSGEFSDAATLTLEWVSQIPGKRESRRFEGDAMVIQQDLIEQRLHADAVSFGGWAIDHHPVEGLYSEKPGCTQWHSKGVYQIPFRALYSRNITNLFLGGRLISASHMAFGSTRVMATCAHNGQAVGHAAALCKRLGVRPRALLDPESMATLQRDLLRTGQYIPEVPLRDPSDLAVRAQITASSRLVLDHLAPNGQTRPLEDAWAMLLPIKTGAMPEVRFRVNVARDTVLRVELRTGKNPSNHTPDSVLAGSNVFLVAGADQPLSVKFNVRIDGPRYVFVCLMANPDVAVHLSDQRVTGVLAVTQRFNKAVAKSPSQEPPAGSGIDSFEFWIPQRRPGGQNFAIEVSPPLNVFGPENLTNGFGRPVRAPNAWVADVADTQPTLSLRWDEPVNVSRVELCFDTDFDHPMESVIMGHPERVMPFCVTACSVVDDAGLVVATVSDNHQSQRTLELPAGVTTTRLSIVLHKIAAQAPASLFAVRCYGPDVVTR